MKTIFWEVTHLSPPKTIQYCKRCGTKTQYISSGLFRVNAQQKSLDIWLVYRCIHCKSTWNSTLYSRINPKSIPAHLLEKFMENDAELARQYAMDASLLKRNGAEVEAPAHKIIGEDIDLTQDIRVELTSQLPSKLKVSKLIREKLSLSKKSFDEMVSGGMIQLENGADIHKCRVQQHLVILFRGICPKTSLAQTGTTSQAKTP